MFWMGELVAWHDAIRSSACWLQPPVGTNKAGIPKTLSSWAKEGGGRLFLPSIWCAHAHRFVKMCQLVRTALQIIDRGLVGHELRLDSTSLFSSSSLSESIKDRSSFFQGKRRRRKRQYATRLKRNIPSFTGRVRGAIWYSHEMGYAFQNAGRDLTSSMTSVQGQQSNPEENSWEKKRATFTTRSSHIDLLLPGRPKAGRLKWNSQVIPFFYRPDRQFQLLLLVFILIFHQDLDKYRAIWND